MEDTMEFLAGTIKTSNAVCELISILMAALIPVVAAVSLKKKTGGGVRPIWVGALGFFVSALVLEQCLHAVVLVIENPVSLFVKSHDWAFCMDGCLAAGLFEETGRYVMFRTMLKKDKSQSTPLLYGIGHGGCESLLIGAIPMMCVFFMALKINAVGSAAALENMAPDMTASFLQRYEPLFSGSPFVLLCAGFERVSAMMLHVALSIVVYLAASQKKFWYAYPAAIAAHAAFDVPAVLFQKKIITNIAVTEVLLFCLGAFVLFCAVKCVLPLTAENNEEQTV